MARPHPFRLDRPFPAGNRIPYSTVTLLAAAGVGLGLFLGGCDSAESNPVRSEARTRVGTTDLKGTSDFDRDLIATKRQGAGQAELMEAAESVLDRYGVPHHDVRSPAATQPDPVPAAAAKSAVVFEPIIRQFQAGNDIHTFHLTVTVKPFKTLTVSALAGEDGTDPFLVAYVKQSGGSAYAYPVGLAAYNDDIGSGNRNAKITWKNPTIGNIQVEVVAFNYLPANRGTVSMEVSVNGIFTYYPLRFLGGAVVYAGNPISQVPKNCSPFRTRVTESQNSPSHYPAAGLVIDTQAKKGGLIWDNRDLGAQSLDFQPVLNTGYPNFALLFHATSSPSGAWNENPSTYYLKQQDFYSCVD